METMTKQMVIVFLGAAIWGCAPNHSDTATLPIVKSRNFYDIYDAVLMKSIANQKEAKVSIVKTTGYHPPFQKCLLKADDSAQWKSAVAAFKKRNQVTHVLANKFHLPFQYELVDKMISIGGVRAPPKGVPYDVFLKNQLASFKKMMKEHRSQARFSVPGVSTDGDIAIVYMANSFSGEFWVLQRHNGNWQVDRAVCEWIS